MDPRDIETRKATDADTTPDRLPEGGRAMLLRLSGEIPVPAAATASARGHGCDRAERAPDFTDPPMPVPVRWFYRRTAHSGGGSSPPADGAEPG